MAFGVYCHIPYCIQRCLYCDFATYEQSQILPPQDYVRLLCEEIRQKKTCYEPRPLDTLYFGGGTPSLIPAELIVAIIQELANSGFPSGPQTEVTLEINPATIDAKKMEIYLKSGVNRFSVGAQTFDDSLLKKLGREHSSQDTRETLRLLKSLSLNYSFDLLFALPHQTKEGLLRDLALVEQFEPSHISTYCLTIPEGHVLSKNRPLEDTQVEMFELITKHLAAMGYERYEISNFARPGFHSRHNCLYWDDQNYWGLGLGAHSYLKKKPWGLRHWNPNSIGAYEDLILSHQGKTFSSPEENLLTSQYENLKKHQALTDFCHISLRRRRGLVHSELEKKFGAEVIGKLNGTLRQLVEDGWLFSTNDTEWQLSPAGLLLSNQVFAALTFLEGEI